MNSERDRAPEYRQHAKACLELAGRMLPGPERARIVEMAQHWLDLATKAEIRKPLCPKCQVEMIFLTVETLSGPGKKSASIHVYECSTCGRMLAEQVGKFLNNQKPAA